MGGTTYTEDELKKVKEREEQEKALTEMTKELETPEDPEKTNPSIDTPEPAPASA